MKLVNAEIKTAEELAQRILNKEKLFNEEGFELMFEFHPDLDSPFVVLINKAGPITAHRIMGQEWDEPQTIQRLAEWHEQTDSLVPCFVWDDYDKENTQRIAMVLPQRKQHASGKAYFETTTHDQWAYATPLTEANLFKAE